MAVNPALFSNLGYDPFKDFTPICELVNAPNVLVVKPSRHRHGRRSGDKGRGRRVELFEPGRRHEVAPDRERLKLRAGIEMVHVPYRGAGPAAPALEERVQVALAAAEGLIKSGQLKALAVTGAERWFSLPEVTHDQGYAGLPCPTPSRRCSAPAGIPADIKARLVQESRAAMKTSEAREQSARVRLRHRRRQLRSRLAQEEHPRGRGAGRADRDQGAVTRAFAASPRRTAVI